MSRFRNTNMNDNITLETVGDLPNSLERMHSIRTTLGFEHTKADYQRHGDYLRNDLPHEEQKPRQGIKCIDHSEKRLERERVAEEKRRAHDILRSARMTEMNCTGEYQNRFDGSNQFRATRRMVKPNLESDDLTRAARNSENRFFHDSPPKQKHNLLHSARDNDKEYVFMDIIAHRNDANLSSNCRFSGSGRASTKSRHTELSSKNNFLHHATSKPPTSQAQNNAVISKAATQAMQNKMQQTIYNPITGTTRVIQRNI